MNLSRRQFLIANGAALALPALPSLSAETKSETKKPSQKLGLFVCSSVYFRSSEVLSGVVRRAMILIYCDFVTEW